MQGARNSQCLDTTTTTNNSFFSFCSSPPRHLRASFPAAVQYVCTCAGRCSQCRRTYFFSLFWCASFACRVVAILCNFGLAFRQLVPLLLQRDAALSRFRAAENTLSSLRCSLPFCLESQHCPDIFSLRSLGYDARRSQLTLLGHHQHHQQLLLLLLLLASPSSACIFSRCRPICLYMCWSVSCCVF